MVPPFGYFLKVKDEPISIKVPKDFFKPM